MRLICDPEGFTGHLLGFAILFLGAGDVDTTRVAVTLRPGPVVWIENNPLFSKLRRIAGPHGSSWKDFWTLKSVRFVRKLNASLTFITPTGGVAIHRRSKILSHCANVLPGIS